MNFLTIFLLFHKESITSDIRQRKIPPPESMDSLHLSISSSSLLLLYPRVDCWFIFQIQPQGLWNLLWFLLLYDIWHFCLQVRRSSGVLVRLLCLWPLLPAYSKWQLELGHRIMFTLWTSQDCDMYWNNCYRNKWIYDSRCQWTPRNHSLH